VATIQIRDVPDDVHQELQRHAKAAGQSLQAYMRDQILEWAQVRTDRAEALQRLEELLAKEGGLGLTAEQIVEDLHAERR
jgi:plasmid stability protein